MQLIHKFIIGVLSLTLIGGFVLVPITYAQVTNTPIASCTIGTTPGIWIRDKDSVPHPETIAMKDTIASERALVRVEFPFTSRQCPGYAMVHYLWKNSKSDIQINKDIEYPLFPNTKPAPGEYTVALVLAYDKDFDNVYFEKRASITIVTANSTNTQNKNNSNNGGTIGTNNGPPVSGNAGINPGLPNNQLNTGIGINYNINYDANLGTFFNPLDAESVPELIVRLTRILFVLTGIVAVIVIIIAGFRMVVDSGNETQMKKAKEAITWAVVGLIVSILAFSIVAIIQRIIQS